MLMFLHLLAASYEKRGRVSQILKMMRLTLTKHFISQLLHWQLYSIYQANWECNLCNHSNMFLFFQTLSIKSILIMLSLEPLTQNISST